MTKKLDIVYNFMHNMIYTMNEMVSKMLYLMIFSILSFFCYKIFYFSKRLINEFKKLILMEEKFYNQNKMINKDI